MLQKSRRFRWPWEDRAQRFDRLKAAVCLFALYPVAWTVFHLAGGGFGPLPLVGLIYWSGVWATVILIATLLVTPVSRTTGWRRLVEIRRILGVAALFYTFAHIVIYFALYRWDMSYIANAMITRPTLIVATVSTIGLAALGATSFDTAVRRMGGRVWKRLHRINYVASGLAIAHFLLSPGIFTLQYVMAGLFIWAMGWRILARGRRSVGPLRLVLLALATAASTIILESVWLWAYQDVTPLQTFADNVTFASGITAACWVLVFGSFIALAAQLPSAAALDRLARR